MAPVKVACDGSEVGIARSPVTISEAVIFDCFLRRLLQRLLRCVGCRICDGSCDAPARVTAMDRILASARAL